MNEVHIRHSTCSLSSTLAVVMPIQWNRIVYRHKTSRVILTASEGKSEQKLHTDHNSAKSMKGKKVRWFYGIAILLKKLSLVLCFRMHHSEGSCKLELVPAASESLLEFMTTGELCITQYSAKRNMDNHRIRIRILTCTCIP